ncbi:hypothetical protein [Dielma fastidiosa]|uniref:Thioredoxin n=1 Tax=Dielma fastidiosa TaxID=1034346 RepID=A0AB35URJ5_9FIRM|nr:hypothetical protein [Dielma fastidiosa]MDY5167725.1 hypothetical protein [Dielma fastidiosa]
MKKTLKIAAVAVAIFAILAALSLLYTYMKLQKVNLSVVNAKLYKESEITDVFEAAEDHTTYVFVYDSENEDCIYLDEVMLRQISNENGEIHFDEIYKINYKDSSSTYNNQIIKNLYSIESIPAIVKVKKLDSGYDILDTFEWSANTKTDIENLTAFLKRNELIPVN